MRRGAFVLLTVFAGACGPAGPENNAGAARNLVAITNGLPPADCPAEELSCGRQRPMISDGVHPFDDPNHYLSVTFPRGDQVCIMRSGSAPHGFGANYGDGMGCEERPDRGPRFISVYAEFNALFWTELAEARPEHCMPLSASTRRRLGPAPLRLNGFPSAICETPRPAGNVEITLYALGGPWQVQGRRPDIFRSRKALYYVTFGTSDAHFDEDLARFRRVLASTRVASREPPVQRVP